MVRSIFIIILFICYQWCSAQCVSGDCVTGKGKFDYGWCVYEGEFKDGKPDGKGIMTYDDYTYEGRFSNGKEDGHGVITYKKDGRRVDVTYTNGVKMEALEKVDSMQWKQLEGYDPNCISGNCETGFGTYVFGKTGNKYTGNFKARRREGQGSFYFADGDRFEGVFRNNEKADGTYYFKATGATYTGTYDGLGKELNGTFRSPGGYAIGCVNGQAVIPKDAKASTMPASAKTTRREPPKETMTVCNGCHGTGKVYESYYGYSVGSEKSYGTTTYRSSYSTCSGCGGSGRIRIK
jgi:hypothetical protein